MFDKFNPNLYEYDEDDEDPDETWEAQPMRGILDEVEATPPEVGYEGDVLDGDTVTCPTCGNDMVDGAQCNTCGFHG